MHWIEHGLNIYVEIYRKQKKGARSKTLPISEKIKQIRTYKLELSVLYTLDAETFLLGLRTD